MPVLSGACRAPFHLSDYGSRACVRRLPGLARAGDDDRISTGPLEGTNTKIRVPQRKAYGFRDAEFFKLKIYALHETRCRLVG